MKLVILTTQTPHHTWFTWYLNQAFPVSHVLLESWSASAPFETEHPFEEQRESYESNAVAEATGGKTAIAEFLPRSTFRRINDPDAIDLLKVIEPDIIIVFGTGLLYQQVIECCPNGIFNLHGGDPEEYRGLDTHLWAIYHRDFENLITTLHRLNPELDDGEVFRSKTVPLAPGMKIHQLRLTNSEVCLNLALDLLSEYQMGRSIVTTPQQKKGRYYSFMPTELKEICRKYFNRHIGTLS